MSKPLDLQKYVGAFTLAYNAGELDVQLRCQELGDLIREISDLRQRSRQAIDILDLWRAEGDQGEGGEDLVTLLTGGQNVPQ